MKRKKKSYGLWRNTAFMLGTSWQVRKSVPLLCIAIALLEVANRLTQLLIAPVILEQVESRAPLSRLMLAILLFGGLLLLWSALLAYVNANTLFGRIEIRMKLMQQIAEKNMRTSFPNTETTEALDKKAQAQEATRTNNHASEAIWNTLTDLLKNILGFVIFLLMLTALDWRLAVVVVITAAASYLASLQANRREERCREQAKEYEHQLYYTSQRASDRAFAKDIRIFSMGPWLREVYSKYLKLYGSLFARREKAHLWASAADVLLAFLRNGAAYLYLISLALSGRLSAPEFLLYFNAAGEFANWVTGILSTFATLHRQCIELTPIREYLDWPEPFRFGDGKPLPEPLKTPCEIRLEDVSFRYPGAERDILSHLNLTIRPGERLAVVGLNGAGKTTLVKLICGLQDPTEGRVLLNGEDIRQYDREAYYRLFSAVFQQFSILEATLAENVAQTVENIDLDRVKDCVNKAGLAQKAEALPQGYETHIGRQVYEDGVELSGGETQRLMLARALYKDGPVLVLDEPTAALDPIAENDIYLKYNQMTQGRTSVYISHRLASTRFCDRILFLENGGIAEEGTHEELMERGGSYAALFQVQSKYYQEEGTQDAC